MGAAIFDWTNHLSIIYLRYRFLLCDKIEDGVSRKVLLRYQLEKNLETIFH